MRRIKTVDYKGQQISVYQHTEVKVFSGGSGTLTSDFVFINKENLSDLVLVMGSQVDDWVESAKQIIDEHFQDASG